MALENKLGITDSAELARKEERISKQKALKLFETGVLDTFAPGTFKTLCAIHKYLFEDIYEFAGKIREVNIAKGGQNDRRLLYYDKRLIISRIAITAVMILIKSTPVVIFRLSL